MVEIVLEFLEGPEEGRFVFPPEGQPVRCAGFQVIAAGRLRFVAERGVRHGVDEDREEAFAIGLRVEGRPGSGEADGKRTVTCGLEEDGEDLLPQTLIRKSRPEPGGLGGISTATRPRMIPRR
jgi:hypothetical protein